MFLKLARGLTAFGLLIAAVFLVSIPLVETAAAATVTAVFPAQGTAAGGTTVAIMGSGFDSTTAVTFGGTAATSYIINSIFQITAITPAHAVGAVDVSVVGAGTGTLTNSYTYATVPDAPTIDTVTAGAASASVAFTAPASDGGSAITGYTVTSSPGGITATGTASPITVSGLTNGTSYTFSVTATNGIGTSNASAASTAVTPVKGTPTVTLPGSSPSVSNYGTSVTFTAVMSGGESPSGTVTFMDSSTTLGSATISGGSASYTTSSLSAGAHIIYAVYGGDTNNDAATSNYWTITVSAPIISLVPTILPTLVVGSAYSQTITASGSVGAYTYSIMSGALPSGLTLTSAGVLSGTPTTVGPYNFTVTATDSAGFIGGRGYSGTVAMASPTVALSASSTSVTPGTSVTFTATLSGAALPSGTVTFKDGSTTLGSAAISGGSASYSTSSLASGSHTITAVYGGDANNNAATSSVVSVSVAAPMIDQLPLTLPNPVAGTAYSQTITASGGTAPYSYTVTFGALPTGLTLASSGVLSGTPTVAGLYDFNITATDAAAYASVKAYGFTVAKASPTVALTASSPSVAAGASVTFTASLSSGALPTGTVTFKDGSTTLGATTVSSGSASYSTSSLASGAHTITAVYDGDTNNNVATSSAVSVSVAAPIIGLTPSSVPNATAGSAYSQTFTASGGTAPYTYAVTIGALPTGLSLTTSSGALSGTPTAAGPYSFTVTATDAGGYTGSTAYTVTVASAAPAIVLAASSTSVVSGGSVTLTASLTGGSSPTGTVTFMDGGSTLGTGALSGGSATFTISALASGSHSITAVYAGDANNASVTSSVVAVTVNVRPDPSQDPTVTAMVTAQATSSARFGQTQITNTVQRLEQLHEEPASGATGGGGQTASAGSSYATSALAYGSGASPESTSTDSSSASQAVGQLSRGLEAAERKAGLPFHLWSSGSVDWGRTDSNGDGRFTSSGFTVGVDRRMSDSLTMGLAGGLAVDHTTFGSDDNWSDGTAYTAQLYASLRLAPQTWLDLVGGYGALQFDSARRSSGSQLDGSRDGHDLFGSVGLSTVREVSGLKLTGYGRFDIVQVALDGYAESGPTSLALAYDALDTTTLAGVAGLKAGYAVPMSWGTLTPGGRLEYRHALDGGFTQSLGYADLGGFGSTISGDSSTRDSATVGLSLDAATFDGLDLDLEYQLSADGGGVASQQVRAGLRLAF